LETSDESKKWQLTNSDNAIAKSTRYFKLNLQKPTTKCHCNRQQIWSKQHVDC
jgi:hypothetical protein